MNFGLFWVVEFALATSNQYLVCQTHLEYGYLELEPLMIRINPMLAELHYYTTVWDFSANFFQPKQQNVSGFRSTRCRVTIQLSKVPISIHRTRIWTLETIQSQFSPYQKRRKRTSRSCFRCRNPSRCNIWVFAGIWVFLFPFSVYVPFWLYKLQQRGLEWLFKSK